MIVSYIKKKLVLLAQSKFTNQDANAQTMKGIGSFVQHHSELKHHKIVFQGCKHMLAFNVYTSIHYLIIEFIL